MRIPAHKIEFYDIDWFGVDSEGHIGHFTSFGSGAIPETVARDMNRLDFIYDCFEEEVIETTQIKIHSNDSAECLESWVSFSRRGLYSFDASTHNDGFYDLIISPKKPLLIKQLPRIIIDELSELKVISYVDFSKETRISVDVFGERAKLKSLTPDTP